jgi:hypothetical protein
LLRCWRKDESYIRGVEQGDVPTESNKGGLPRREVPIREEQKKEKRKRKEKRRRTGKGMVLEIAYCEKFSERGSHSRAMLPWEMGSNFCCHG